MSQILFFLTMWSASRKPKQIANPYDKAAILAKLIKIPSDTLRPDRKYIDSFVAVTGGPFRRWNRDFSYHKLSLFWQKAGC